MHAEETNDILTTSRAKLVRWLQLQVKTLSEFDSVSHPSVVHSLKIKLQETHITEFLSIID